MKMRSFQQEKHKIGQCKILCRYTVLECRDRIPIESAKVCCNMDQGELKLEIMSVAT